MENLNKFTEGGSISLGGLGSVIDKFNTKTVGIVKNLQQVGKMPVLPMPFLKKVEDLPPFQKIRVPQPSETLVGEDLRFTFCDVNDLQDRPFGNLFTSFRLPTSNTERQRLKTQFKGTALNGLGDVSKIIIAEIPQNRYGELVDGKTIELRIPQKKGGVRSSVSLFGSYFEFNSELNNQISDANIISAQFGVEPTIENEFNTNVAYLFCNEINPPIDNYTTTEVIPFQNISLRPNEKIDLANQTGPLLPGKTYEGNIVDITNQVTVNAYTTAGVMPLADAIERSGQFTFRVKFQVSKVELFNQEQSTFAYPVRVNQYTAVSSRPWSSWSTTNRFPQNAQGSGKAFARFRDPFYQLLVDEPVGIAYLDKGFFVITNPTLIENFDNTDALYRNDVGAIVPYPQSSTEKERFTSVFFAESTDAMCKYRSISTEYQQTITCIAGPNEFFATNNTTFPQAYPQGNLENAPVFITEIGVYNKFSELIAIAKTPYPLSKDSIETRVFTVRLKV